MHSFSLWFSTLIIIIIIIILGSSCEGFFLQHHHRVTSPISRKLPISASPRQKQKQQQQLGERQRQESNVALPSLVSWSFSTRLRANTRDDSNDSSNNDEDDERLQDPQFRLRNRHWVVLVDDESSIRLSVGDFLFEEGYQVSACSDAEALLALVKTPMQFDEFPKTPHAIISDVRMPGGKDGIALLNILRRDIRLQRVPVILLTAKSLTVDRIEGYRAGADLYLPKPFAPEELLAMVDNVILRRSQMTASENGKLVDLQQGMAAIKTLLRQNQQRVNRATEVFLTQAQRDTLELVGEGLTNVEVARQMGVSRQQIMKNMTDMMALTRTSNRTELVRWAIQTGYLSSKRRKKKEKNKHSDDPESVEPNDDNEEENRAREADDDGVQVWR